MLEKTTRAMRQYYQYILSAILIIVIVLVVYGGDLGILANEALQNETLSYILFIPFFAGILFYFKKDMVVASLALEDSRKTKRNRARRYTDALVGAVLCIIAFLTYWYGSHTFYPLEYHILSLPILLLGLTLILFNRKATLVLILPAMFLVFLVPPPTEFVYSIGGTLGNFNTQASYTLLKAFGLPVALSTSYGSPTIMLRNLPFTVDLPCSGIYSLMAFATFAVFLALVVSAPLVKKIVIALFGFITFEALNLARITATISIANGFGQDIAMNLFHPTAGIFLIFIGMLLVLIVGDKLLKIQIIPKTQKIAACPECDTSSKKLRSFCLNCGRPLGRNKTSISKESWAKLLLIVLVCSTVALSLNAPTFAITQGPKGITYGQNWTNSQNTANAFPNITGYQPPSFLLRDFTYEQIAHQDASLWYVYTPESASVALTRGQPLVYVDVGIADSISNLHNWEVCLYSYPIAQGQTPTATVLDSRDIELLPDVPIIGRYFTFVSPYGYTQVTLFWYEQASFNVGVTVVQKFVRISLVVLIQNSTIQRQVEDQLLPIGQTVASYWEPMRTRALVSLGIPTLQASLAVSIAAVIFIETTQYFADFRRKTTNQRLFGNFASKDEKKMLQTLQTITATKKTMKTQEIREAIKQTMGKSLDEESLQKILAHFEEYGFVKKDIISINNKPLLIWKT
jgi:exosortase